MTIDRCGSFIILPYAMYTTETGEPKYDISSCSHHSLLSINPFAKHPSKCTTVPLKTNSELNAANQATPPILITYLVPLKESPSISAFVQLLMKSETSHCI
jgi:hypothetical protein